MTSRNRIRRKATALGQRIHEIIMDNHNTGVANLEGHSLAQIECLIYRHIDAVITIERHKEVAE